MRVLCLVGWSGSGKTTLLTGLIPELTARGFRVSTIKHAHHEFELDRPGKDSFRHRKAGAHEVMIANDRQFALFHEHAPALPLQDLLPRLAPVDLVLVEGFKSDPFPKLEVHRPALGKPLLWPDDPHVVALASDVPPAPGTAGTPPWVDLDDVYAVATLIVATFAPWSSPVAGGAPRSSSGVP